MSLHRKRIVYKAFGEYLNALLFIVFVSPYSSWTALMLFTVPLRANPIPAHLSSFSAALGSAPASAVHTDGGRLQYLFEPEKAPCRLDVRRYVQSFYL